MFVRHSVAPMIESARLALVPMPQRFLEALLAGRRAEAERLARLALPGGWPDEHDRRFLRFRLDQLARDATSADWMPRAIVLRERRRPMIGHIGFHGPPGRNAPGHADAVEIGYTVFEPFRGRGHATEAVRALLAWARAERGIRHFVASVAPDNVPSLALVRRLGFERTGRHWDDEDGEELEFELVYPA
jgi:RimJ/RimL family protein N-acetyltransferase